MTITIIAFGESGELEEPINTVTVHELNNGADEYDIDGNKTLNYPELGIPEIECYAQGSDETNAESYIPESDKILLGSAELEETWTAITAFSQVLFREVLASEDKNIVFSPLSAYYAMATAVIGMGDYAAYEFQAVHRNPWSSIAAIEQLIWNFTYSPFIHSHGTFQHNTSFYIDEAETYFAAGWWGGPSRVYMPLDVFTSESGQAHEDYFMRHHERFGTHALVTDYYEALMLRLGCRRVGFFLVRPTNGIAVREFVATRDLFDIFNRIELIDYRGIIQIPFFDKMYTFDLNDYIEALGFAATFNNISNDMLGYDEENNEYIATIKQSAEIALNLYGINASYTRGIPSPLGGDLDKELHLSFNSPFIYAVIDTETGVPLLMGVVDYP